MSRMAVHKNLSNGCVVFSRVSTDRLRVLLTLAFLLICDDPQTSRIANGARIQVDCNAPATTSHNEAAAQNLGQALREVSERGL